ncbi:PE-PPE domain-containing protein [bacterium]|nr:MAG: PE-PPE domain-containing protein [bacterium]
MTPAIQPVVQANAAVQLAAQTTELYSRGTGGTPGVVQTPLAHNVGKVVMNDQGYPAEIMPLPGATHTYDQSTKGGIVNGVERIKDMREPIMIVCGGYSQGARVAGDVCTEAVKQGVRSADDVKIYVESDPRMRGTGFEVVMQKYGPFTTGLMGATMNGERKDVGIAYNARCARYDAVCSMEDPLTNPLGAAASLTGFLTGYHGTSAGVNNLPRHTVCYEPDYCVEIIETEHPFSKLAEQGMQGPITPQADAFIKAIAPSTDPGSRDLASPDMLEVATTGINMVSAAMGGGDVVPTMEMPKLGVDMSNGNGGNPMDQLTQAAAPLMEQAAPVIDQLVSQAPPEVQQFVAPIVEQFVPQSAPEPAYSAPAPAQDFVQQVQDVVSSFTTPAVGNVAAPAAPAMPAMPDLGAMAASFLGGV